MFGRLENPHVSKGRVAAMILAVSLMGAAASLPSLAHCDTLGGPVVQSARLALEKGDVTPVLMWVKPEHEAEIRKAFKETLAVRAKGPEARDLADRYFFETLVRIHRAGEGAPYTGLKPADEVEPIIAISDHALDEESVGTLLKSVTEDVTKGIRDRYGRVLEAKKHMNESVEAGRRYVAAYVAYTHYVERLYADAATDPVHHGAEETEPETAHHQ